MHAQFSFPLVGSPKCPLQGQLTRGKVRLRANGSGKKESSNPTVVKIYSSCKSCKNTGPWDHNAGSLPTDSKGPEQLRGLELEFLLLQRVGLCLSWGQDGRTAGAAQGRRHLAQVHPEPFLRRPQFLEFPSTPSCKHAFSPPACSSVL